MPLLDGRNKKADPDCSVPKGAADTCRRILDFSKVVKTNITVTVFNDKNEPLPDYPITIKALVRASSGGHDHTSDRPTGRFIFVNDTSSVLQCNTDVNGKVKLRYLSSGFGGVDSIFVKGKTNKDTATATIVLRISELQELTEGVHYDLVGMYNPPSVTSQHSTNHFGTTRLIQKLKALADSLHKESSYVMRVNDMSLIYGGPFDAENNWNTPHQNHRQGVNVDISYTATGGRRIPEKDFEDWVKTLKGIVNPHGHYHTTFR